MLNIFTQGRKRNGEKPCLECKRKQGESELPMRDGLKNCTPMTRTRKTMMKMVLNRIKCIFGGHRYKPSEVTVKRIGNDKWLMTARCIYCGKIRQDEVQIPIFDIVWQKYKERNGETE